MDSFLLDYVNCSVQIQKNDLEKLRTCLKSLTNNVRWHTKYFKEPMSVSIGTIVPGYEKVFDSYSLFSLAVYEGNPESIDLLIEFGANIDSMHPTEPLTMDDFPLLHCAISGNRPRTVELLLRHGFDPNFIVTLGNGNLLTLCHEKAIENPQCVDRFKIMELLLRFGAKITVDKNYGLTVILHLAHLGMFNYVKLLIRYGADVNHMDGYKQNTMMHFLYNPDNYANLDNFKRMVHLIFLAGFKLTPSLVEIMMNIAESFKFGNNQHSASIKTFLEAKFSVISNHVVHCAAAFDRNLAKKFLLACEPGASLLCPVSFKTPTAFFLFYNDPQCVAPTFRTKILVFDDETFTKLSVNNRSFDSIQDLYRLVGVYPVDDLVTPRKRVTVRNVSALDSQELAEYLHTYLLLNCCLQKFANALKDEHYDGKSFILHGRCKEMWQDFVNYLGLDEHDAFKVETFCRHLCQKRRI